MVEIVDSVGRKIEVVRSADQRIGALVVHTREGAMPLRTYQFTPAGDLARTVDADGHAEWFEYDDEHRLTKWKDSTNLTYHYRYDHEGRCRETWGDYDGLPIPGLSPEAPALLADNQTTARGINQIRIEYLPDGTTTVADSVLVQRYHSDEGGAIEMAVSNGAVLRGRSTSMSAARSPEHAWFRHSLAYDIALAAFAQAKDVLPAVQARLRTDSELAFFGRGFALAVFALGREAFPSESWGKLPRLIRAVEEPRTVALVREALGHLAPARRDELILALPLERPEDGWEQGGICAWEALDLASSHRQSALRAVTAVRAWPATKDLRPAQRTRLVDALRRLGPDGAAVIVAALGKGKARPWDAVLREASTKA